MIIDSIKENNQTPSIPERKINDSEKQTIELFNNGKNPEEVANIHNPKLSIGTIWKHIAKGVSLNLIPVSKFLSNEGYIEIESAIKKYIEENYILERLQPIYKSLESKYHYEQIKYALFNFTKKVECGNGTVRLHPFIDGWLQSREAYYENDQETVQDGTRLNENGVKWYLGSIFPKSFAESYSIYYDLLSNTKYNEKLSRSKSIKILDIGGGTGGNVAGIILAIINKLPNIQEIVVDAYDPCVESRNAYIDLITYIDKIINNCGSVHINLQCKPLMLQPESTDAQNDSYTFSDFSTFLTRAQKSYDLIMSFKMINELIRHGHFEHKKPYFSFFESLCPLLNENGVLILEDISGDNGIYYCKRFNNETRDYLASQNEFKILSPIPCAIKQRNCNYVNCFMQEQVKIVWTKCPYNHMTSRFSYKILSFANTCHNIVPTQFNYRYKKVYMGNANNDNNNDDHWCYPGKVDMNLEEKDAFKIGDYGRENNNN